MLERVRLRPLQRNPRYRKFTLRHRSIAAMNIYEAASLSAAICLGQRLLMAWRVHRASDSWMHLCFVVFARRQSAGVYGPISLAPGHCLHYPLLSHRILGVLPEALIVRFAGYLNSFVEAIGLFLMIALLGENSTYDSVAIYTGVCYAFSPILFSKVTIGTASHFSPRLYSEICCNLFVIAVWGPAQLPNQALLPIVLCCTCYLLMGSKFGTQVLAFVLLPALVITSEWLCLATIPIAAVICHVVSRGRFALAIGEQVAHLAWYWKVGRHSVGGIGPRNSISVLRRALAAPTPRAKFVQIGLALFARNAWTAVLLKMPTLVYLLSAICFGANPAAINNLGRLAPVLGISLAIFVLTNFGPLRVFGEAERYLTHVSASICYGSVVTAVSDGNAGGFLAFVLALGVAYSLAEFVLLGLFTLNRPEHDEDGAARLIEAWAKPGDSVLAYPYHVLPPGRVLLETKAVPIFPVFGLGGDPAVLRIHESYPYMKLSSLPLLRATCRARFLVAQASELSAADRESLASDEWLPLPASQPTGIEVFAHASALSQSRSETLVDTGR
jgi:hypothetical protein